MQRKRRGPKYTWFPNIGLSWANGGNIYRQNRIEILLQAETAKYTAPSDTGGSLVCAPIVPDFTAFETAAEPFQFTLADQVSGQDWFLRRIVGKVNLQVLAGTATPAGGAQWGNVFVTLGFFVARALDADPTNVGLQDEEVDPQNADNIRQPWLWRRTWTLSDTSNSAFSGSSMEQPFPGTTCGYGSMAEGGHIDAKTMRRIRREERLWYALSVVGADIGSADVSGDKESQPHVAGTMDLRLLGALRKSRNASTF